MPAPCTIPRRFLLGLALILPCAPTPAQQPPPDPPPTAEAIMARVTVNQERSVADRVHYVYLQHARVLSRKGKTVLCEEITDSRITPSPTGSHADLLKLDGRVLTKHQYVAYTAPLPPQPGAGGAAPDSDKALDSFSITLGGDDDRELVENLRVSLTRDDVNYRLFPLTSTGQKAYAFHLVGRDHINGRDVFHIDFRPRDKSDFGWKGDAYIDTATFQPVVISTAMARKIPLAARTLLGTNVPGLGFTITYAPQPDGVWFPVSFGTEFKLHVLFFFSRQIIIDALNRNFEKPTSPPRWSASATPSIRSSLAPSLRNRYRAPGNLAAPIVSRIRSSR